MSLTTWDLIERFERTFTSIDDNRHRSDICIHEIKSDQFMKSSQTDF